MRAFLPTEHLSPRQHEAYLALESERSTIIKSSNFLALVDILNLLISGQEVTIACDEHTRRLLEDYKLHHSLVTPNIDHIGLVEKYQNAILQLKDAYNNCYPTVDISLAQKYIQLLQANGIDPDTPVELDSKLEGIPKSLLNNTEELKSLLKHYKKTWTRYKEIDPLDDKYYLSQDQNSLQQYLRLWIHSVQAIKNDMERGLQQISDAEKFRLLAVKKQISQHLINYQHDPKTSELDLVKKKIAFILSDLPTNSFNEFTELVMFALTNWESATSNYLDKFIKRFNSRNHESALIQEATQELKVVLRDIDNNGYLKLKITNQPLNYTNQISQVQDLLNQLQYCQDWLNYEGEYIHWNKFYNALNQSERQYVDRLQSLDQSNLDTQFIYLKLNLWKQDVISSGIPSIKDSINAFETYKELTSTLDWSAVQFINSSANADLYFNYDGAYYTVSNEIENGAQLNIIINDKELFDIKPMVSLDYYKQSKQAENLTHAIVASAIHPRIFQSRGLNIISVLDDTDTNELISMLTNVNINELKGESITELIKGSILDEGKEKIIIVYDELLNVFQTNNYFWQRLVLQSMETSGYRVLSINTRDILEHLNLNKQISNYLSPSEVLTKV